MDMFADFLKPCTPAHIALRPWPPKTEHSGGDDLAGERATPGRDNPEADTRLTDENDPWNIAMCMTVMLGRRCEYHTSPVKRFSE